VRRGPIDPVVFADLVLFDPEAVTDHATPAQPHLASTGIEDVCVNRRAVWRHGATAGLHPGRVIKRARPLADATLQ
jgi:N-acyl-D-amino-acid deacylase